MVAPGEISRSCACGTGSLSCTLRMSSWISIGVRERRQRAEPPRQVFVRGSGYAERAEAIVAGEVQVFEQRQPRRFVDEADDALAPAVGPCVVHGARGGALLGRQKLLIR